MSDERSSLRQIPAARGYEAGVIRHLLVDVFSGSAAAVVAESDAALLVFVVACCLGGLGLGVGSAWAQLKWMQTFGVTLRPLAAAAFGLLLAAFAAFGTASLALAYFKA